MVLAALTVLLASAIAFQWQGTIIAAAIGLTVVIVHILSEIHQRLLQLEQAAPSYFAQSAGIGMQRMVIYSAALVALFAYANTWMWLAGGALLVLMLCLIQTINLCFHLAGDCHSRRIISSFIDLISAGKTPHRKAQFIFCPKQLPIGYNSRHIAINFHIYSFPYTLRLSIPAL